MANFPYSSIVKSDFRKNHAKEWLHRKILLLPGDFYLNSGVENVSFMNVRKIGGENFSQHTVMPNEFWMHTCQLSPQNSFISQLWD